MNEDRVSIWSVHRDFHKVYYGGFAVVVAVGLAEVWVAGPTSELSFQALSAVVIAGAGLSLWAVELGMFIGGSLMVLGSWLVDWWEERKRKKGNDGVELDVKPPDRRASNTSGETSSRKNIYESSTADEQAKRDGEKEINTG